MGNAAVAHVGNALSATNDWIKAPFVGSASPLVLFLAVGLVMVFVILWTRILGHLSSLGV
jgi:hypothetical protein